MHIKVSFHMTHLCHENVSYDITVTRNGADAILHFLWSDYNIMKDIGVMTLSCRDVCDVVLLGGFLFVSFV